MRVECGVCKRVYILEDKDVAENEGDVVFRCKACNAPIRVHKTDDDTTLGTHRYKIDYSGNLLETGVPDAIQTCHVGMKTGRLVLKGERGEVSVFFKEGHLVYARSSDDREGMAYYLFKHGRLPMTDLIKVNDAVRTSKIPQEMAIQRTVGWPPEEFQICLDTYIRDLIISTFSWTEGEFSFSEAATPTHQAGELVADTTDLILEGVRTINEWGLLRRSLSDLALILQVRDDVSKKIERTHLMLDEREVLALIDGKKTVADVCALAPCGDFAATRAMYAFLAAGLVRKVNLKKGPTPEVEEKPHKTTGIHSRLRRKEGGRVAQEIPIGSRILTFGRSLSADIYVSSERASRRHAQIMVRDGELVLRDLGSTNGTFVNGKRVFREKLRLGDVILVGDIEFEVGQ